MSEINIENPSTQPLDSKGKDTKNSRAKRAKLRDVLKLRRAICRLKVVSSNTSTEPREPKAARVRERLEETQEEIENMLRQLGSGLHWWGSLI